MKRGLLFCLAFSMVIGCKKSEPPFNSYLTMNIDGATYHVWTSTKAIDFGSPELLKISAISQNLDFYIEFSNPVTGITR